MYAWCKKLMVGSDWLRVNQRATNHYQLPIWFGVQIIYMAPMQPKLIAPSSMTGPRPTAIDSALNGMAATEHTRGLVSTHTVAIKEVREKSQ